MSKVHVLGTCYVCGRKAWGYRAIAVPDTERHKGKVVVRDINGIRHGGCDPWPNRGASRVTLSDA